MAESRFIYAGMVGAEGKQLSKTIKTTGEGSHQFIRATINSKCAINDKAVEINGLFHLRPNN